MGKHDHEYGNVFNRTKRFFAEQLRGRFAKTQVRQQLTYATTLLSVAVLLYAAMGDVWARPLLAVTPPLGTAGSFAVLAGSTAVNTGPTLVIGDLGVNPGSAITGFPPGIVLGGTIHAADAVAVQAQTDVTTAYNNLAGQACDANKTSQDLGGQTLTPGVYCFDTSAQLTGQLTLDGQGDPNAIFVFQIGSTLTTASNASVLLINSAAACNIFWQMGSSATLGTGTAFVGSMLALTSITLNTSATVLGRALARNGSVTMDTNNISMLCTLATPTPVDTATPIPVDTATPIPVDTATPTPVDTVISTPVDTATPTLIGTATPTLIGTATPTAIGTATPTSTSTPLLTDVATLQPDMATLTPENEFPPTGLHPIDEPSASSVTLYLPFLIR